jgi:hypothetical protein
MYSKISFLSQMWLPVVMTCAPRSKSSSAMEGVMPKPPAAFSPLMMSRSTALVRRRGEVFADDVAAGRAEDVADEENIHRLSLARVRGELLAISF